MREFNVHSASSRSADWRCWLTSVVINGFEISFMALKHRLPENLPLKSLAYPDDLMTRAEAARYLRACDRTVRASFAQANCLLHASDEPSVSDI